MCSCYLIEHSPLTIDPQSILNNRPNVLDPPSLNDDSKYHELLPVGSSIEHRNADLDAWGDADAEPLEEPHALSTDRSSDRLRSVSDASQNVTDESVVRKTSFDSKSSRISPNPEGEVLNPFAPPSPTSSISPVSRQSKHITIDTGSDELSVPSCFHLGNSKGPKCPRTTTNPRKAQ